LGRGNGIRTLGNSWTAVLHHRVSIGPEMANDLPLPKGEGREAEHTGETVEIQLGSRTPFRLK